MFNVAEHCLSLVGEEHIIMLESTVTTKGQTTLPKDVRKALGLQPGDKLRYILLVGEIRLLRARPVLDLEGVLRRPGQKTVTLEEMEEAIAMGTIDVTQ